MAVNYKSLILYFLIGGFLLSGIKFTSMEWDNPAFSAIIGGIPIGLLSIYTLSSDKSVDFSHNYFYVTLILASSILLFHVLITHTKLNKNIALTISFGLWIGLVTLNYFIQRKDKVQ